MLTLVGRKKMYNHIAVIEHEPAFVGFTGDTALLLVFLFRDFQHALGERIQHAVTGAVADHEIIGKRGNVFNIQ